LEYNCNAIQAWYINLIGHFAIHYFGILDLGEIVRNLGPLTIVAIIFADVTAIVVFFLAQATGNVHKYADTVRCTLFLTFRASGNSIYDFFIGIWLHPRIGNVS
jgi:delta24(24(1))-sterol reductase